MGYIYGALYIFGRPKNFLVTCRRLNPEPLAIPRLWGFLPPASGDVKLRTRNCDRCLTAVPKCLVYEGAVLGSTATTLTCWQRGVLSPCVGGHVGVLCMCIGVVFKVRECMASNNHAATTRYSIRNWSQAANNRCCHALAVGGELAAGC